ncbi:transmembrane protein [Legionella busanensis]|uniref:Transmembrane protein n=1 Tax=Legionella busanensis TaxID=190655 RepID=A0A378KAM4_9GAMM|nr:hypothetical protein [Legionella busanensis]STX81380.1 transmembrane protein [Legionella busanensis]
MKRIMIELTCYLFSVFIASNQLYASTCKLARLDVKSPSLTLIANSLTDVITLTNKSTCVTAANVRAKLPNSWLDVTQDASDCVYLAPGQSCELRFRPGQTDYLEKPIQIRGSNTKTVTVQAAVKRLFIYIANANVPNNHLGKITRCQIGSNGILNQCKNSRLGREGFFDIVIHPTGKWAYISEFYSGGVYKCGLTRAGTLRDCGVILNNRPDHSPPSGITLNAVGTLAYLAYWDHITTCQIKADGHLSPCRNSSFIKGSPREVILNSTETNAYISLHDLNAIFKCGIDANGVVHNCSEAVNGLAFAPLSITLNRAGSLAYLINELKNSISKCNIETNGNFSHCINLTSPTFYLPKYLAFHPIEPLAYITNSATNAISTCFVTTNGDLIDCKTNLANMDYPIGITLILL